MDFQITLVQPVVLWPDNIARTALPWRAQIPRAVENLEQVRAGQVAARFLLWEKMKK